MFAQQHNILEIIKVVNKFKRGSRMERKENQRKIKLQTELDILEKNRNCSFKVYKLHFYP